MAGNFFREMVIALGLKTDDVEAGIARLGKGFKDLATKAIQIFSVVGAAAFVKSTVSNYLSMADSVGKLSDALGIDIVDMQAWQQAATLAGGSADGFNQSIENLNQRVSQLIATGGGKAKAYFESLGLSIEAVEDKVKPTTNLLLELASQFEGLDIDTAFGIGKNLGLDRGTVMLLQQGRVAVEDLLTAQRELAAYTKRDAEIAARANDAFAQLGVAWRGAMAIAMRFFIPILSRMVEALTAIVQWVRRNERFIMAFFIGLATVITAVVLPALAKMAIAWMVAMAPLLLIGAAVAAVVAIIALLIDDFLAWSEGGGSVFGALWERLAPLIDKVKELWTAAQPLLSWLADFGMVLGGIVFDYFILGLQTIIDAVISIINIFGYLKDFIVAIFKGDLSGAAEAFWNILKEIFGFLGRLIGGVKDFFAGAANKIKNFFGLGGDDEEPQPQGDGFGGDNVGGLFTPNYDYPNQFIPETSMADSLDQRLAMQQPPAVNNDTAVTTNIQQVTINAPDATAAALNGALGGVVSSSTQQGLVDAARNGGV